MMKVASAIITDVGRKRTRNEDSYLVNEDVGLYIIADGMGGHLGGAYASRLAVTTIEEVLQAMIMDNEATMISGVNTEEADNGDRLRYAIEMASSKIYDKSLGDTSLKGMGTTAVAALFEDSYAFVANVGDSRAYLFHANKMKQITLDHSLVSEQLEAGLITQKDAKGHKLKNIITRSVGYQEDVEIDVNKYEMHMGDKILMCTDGLSNMLEDGEIERIVNELSLKEACKRLVDRANEKGGEDNITVLLTEVVEV